MNRTARLVPRFSSLRTAVFSSQKRVNQNVLKKREKGIPAQSIQKKHSYILRYVMPGFVIICIVCAIVIIFQSYWHSIDLSESRTFLIESTDTGASLVVVSLRGSERAVNFSVLERKSQQYFFPIEKKIETTNVFETNNPRSSLLADFGPWRNETTSSLSIVDRFKLWWYVFPFDAAAFTKQTVSNETAAQLTTIQKYFADTTLRSNAPTIAVINTTDRNGAASQVGDRLSAWGMRVIQVDSDQERTVSVTQLVVGDSEQSSRTVELLRAVLPNIQVITDVSLTQRYRAAFVLFIGDEYPVEL